VKKLTFNVPDGVRIITASALLLALLDMPSGYYQLLRLLVCSAAVLEITRIFAEGHKPNVHTCLVLSFGLVALLFNPVFQVELEREEWAGIDVAVAALFLGRCLLPAIIAGVRSLGFGVFLVWVLMVSLCAAGGYFIFVMSPSPPKQVKNTWSSWQREEFARQQMEGARFLERIQKENQRREAEKSAAEKK
jgi:hypothetical protein